MKSFKRFATNHPILFGLVMTFLFLLFVSLAGVFAYPVSGEGAQAWVSAGVMLVGVFVFLAILWRFGWLRLAGVTALGNGRTWLKLLPALVYIPLVFVVGFFWPFWEEVGLPEPGMVTAVLINNLVDGGLLQEIAFRGVVLAALVQVRGRTKIGLAKSVFVSALIFSLVHLFNMLNLLLPGADGVPVTLTLLQVLNTLMAGIYLAVFVLHGGSIWTAVIIHGCGNAFVNILAAGTPGFSETASAWFIINLLLLPVLIFSLYLLPRIPFPPGATDVIEPPLQKAKFQTM